MLKAAASIIFVHIVGKISRYQLRLYRVRPFSLDDLYEVLELAWESSIEFLLNGSITNLNVGCGHKSGLLPLIGSMVKNRRCVIYI